MTYIFVASEKMEIVYRLIVAAATAGFLLVCVWRTLNWAWLKPRKAEKLLREQGLRGKSYRFLIGDVKERARVTAKVKSKPMEFTHDIVPRVLPFISNIVNTFGMFVLLNLGFFFQLILLM